MYNKKIKKIILEGFWGSGKTTLANILKREEKFLFIKEPNHSTEKKGSINIDNWYIKKHQLKINKQK
nr:deoxynucleoside kinase [Planctomycetota bacterium]